MKATAVPFGFTQSRLSTAVAQTTEVRLGARFPTLAKLGWGTHGCGD
jgi:hypothetical protein